MSCGTSVIIPNNEARVNGSPCVCKKVSIEFAPATVHEIEKHRKDAAQRIADWKTSGNPMESRSMSDEQIAYDGYRWREFVKVSPDYGWYWAMWEQCQLLAAKTGVQFNDLNEQEYFNNPRIPNDILNFANPELAVIEEEAKPIVFRFKKNNTKSALTKFLQSKKGKLFGKLTQRQLWGLAVSPENNHYFCDKSYIAGIESLKNAKTFEEALETEITVYRGIRDGDCPDAVKKAKIESWTASKKMATTFAEGYFHSINRPGTGTVLEKKIKLKEVKAFVQDEMEIILKK